MGHYRSNVRDLEFNLFEVFGRQQVLGTGRYEDLDVDTARKDTLNELFGRLDVSIHDIFAGVTYHDLIGQERRRREERPDEHAGPDLAPKPL